MIDLSDVANGVLVSAIGATGKWLATAARAPRGRKAEDLSVARWFETYKLTADPPEELSSLAPADAELVADALRGPDIQGTLQELLSARLTNAPEADAARARETFCLTLPRAVPAASSFASALADYYDEQVSELVARLQAADPALLTQIRSEAFSSRMIAVLNAIERHTAAVQSVPRDADTFMSAYRRQVIDHHGKLQPPDFDRRRRVPIRDIYVPGLIDEEAPSKLEFRTKDVITVATHTIWDLADLIDRSVLLGDPGGGKTTASNVLMHHFASDTSSRFPFLVTLRDFASEDPPSRSVVSHIEHQLETFYQCPAPAGLVDALLLTGRAIVFFDGLDELLDPARRAGVAERVERFCAEYPLAPVLVTSRFVGYDQARLDDRQFTCYRLGEFNDENVADYVRKWFAIEDDCQPEDADTFLTESESVPDLRTNPLLLSLMCILYRGEGSLPRNRAEVYEQCANLLFRKWDARRKIHAELRAAHLVEPALRHLALWLFTREDTQPAVTERELVIAATEFLHGRGFESIGEARDAAQEFIEFCRGRMWVFSDTGTTATGENLYSFTHRTFLEYFTAAHLAYDSDTPEKLARIILPHVARGEWEIVAELAVQIKNRTSTDGARRIYERLLKDQQYSSPRSHSNILQFLARTLRSVDPPPQVVRRLTREVVSFLFSGDPDSDMHALPAVWLLASCGACLSVVDEEVSTSTAAMIASDNRDTHANGLRLAVSLHNRLSEHAPSKTFRFWADRSQENASKYQEEIIAAAKDEFPGMLVTAIVYDLIRVDEALGTQVDLTWLMQYQPMHIFNIRWSAIIDESDILIGSSKGDALSAVGNYLTEHLTPPWVTQKARHWSRFDWDTSAKPSSLHQQMSRIRFLGAAAITCISVESDPSFLNHHLSSDISRLSPFEDLYPYIQHRSGEQRPAFNALPDLPVPDEFKQVFRDWANNEVNFVGHSPDPQ